MKWSSLLASAFAASSAYAQLATFDTGSQIEYSLSIPSSTAENGQGDIFFQLKGPSQNIEWIALGMGSEMAGSQIFVMYADGNGNVTVSPRLGVGEVMPKFYSKPQIELLEGTGISNGQMVANVRCSNCESWDGGSLDFSSTSQPFIWAHRTGAPIDSTSESAMLVQHQVEGDSFGFNMKVARGGNGNNPFVGPAPPTASGSPSGSGSGSTGSTTSVESPLANVPMLQKAHGTIMGLVFVLLLPIGGLMMRVLGFQGVIWAHAAWQMLSFLLFTAAFGIGVYMADELGILYESEGSTHTIFGTVIFGLVWLQPILGYVHHMMFKKHHARTAVSHGHIWYGRILIILGIVNGGLGLKLADNTTGGTIAYGVVAGVMGVIYIAVVLWSELRRKSTRHSEK